MFAVASLVAFLLALLLHLLKASGGAAYDCVLFGAVFLAAHFAFGRWLPFWYGP